MAARARVPVPVALRFAYDGRRFDSYARQPDPGLRTVEGELLAALAEVGAVADPARAGWRSGSRTDKGVSARQNVACFRSVIPPERLPLALLDRVEGLWPTAAAAVAPGFDPRRAAWREYRYFLPALSLPEGVTPKRFQQALQVFVGRHDFSVFSRQEPGRSPVREVFEVELVVPSTGGRDRDLFAQSGTWVVRVRGASFLWQQVRRMVQAALDVAAGEGSLGALQEALGPGGGAHPGGWGVAAPDGLVLWQVHDPRLALRPPPGLAEALFPGWVREWGRAWTVKALLGALAEDAGEATARGGVGGHRGGLP